MCSSALYRPTFAAGEAVVAGGGDDGVVMMWDVRTGGVLRCLCGHTAPVLRAVWYAPLCMLATVSEDASIRIWVWDDALEV
jgi:WD40 repeat protein